MNELVRPLLFMMKGGDIQFNRKLISSTLLGEGGLW